MKHHLTKKIAAIALTAGLVLGGGGIAFAYFTSSGGGTGSATVGTTGGSDFSVTSSWADASLYPGTPAVPFTITVTNNGSGDEHVGYVDIAVASDPDTGFALENGSPVADCMSNWFSVTPQVTVDSTISAGASDSDIAGPSIQMTDSSTDQDACQGHLVDMTFTVSNGV